MQTKPGYRIAVAIPCLNEEVAVGRVVTEFARALPEAAIFVFDNASEDQTGAVAKAAGATVVNVWARGKGNVVRRIFADIDADIYLLVDGDGTYDAASAPRLVARLVEGGFDMVTGCRVQLDKDAYRRGHAMGNRMFNRFLSFLFGASCRDIFTGYRVLSRRFVKSFPAESTGFEIETELTVHALELKMPIAELETPYRSREEGSSSKLKTYHDGARILWAMIDLYRIERPFAFFGLLGTGCCLLAIVLAIPLFATYLETGLVPRVPTAILATGLVLLGAVSVYSGLLLDTVTRGRRETRTLAYLSVPAVSVGTRGGVSGL